MAQILRFPESRYPQVKAEKHARLLDAFSCRRRAPEDVFWLKENAELLNILECTGTAAEALPQRTDARLAALQAFHAGAARHLCFFRQYYRFILSICMDLEDLGLVAASPAVTAGPDSQALAHWVWQQELPTHELSDLQRAEARRLLARRGVHCDFPGLDERLHRFIDGAENFAMPNRKAAYELTHIVFYLSDYGRSDPGLSPRAIESLTHVGLLAFLDRDADLLAEVCIALRYAGQAPAAAWQSWLDRHTGRFALMLDRDVQAPPMQQDDYHMFLVGNWQQALSEGGGFAQAVPEGSLRLQRPQQQGILNSLSQAVFAAGSKSVDWQVLRPQITAQLTEEEHQFLCEVEQSCPDFGVFFEGFARTGSIGADIGREALA